MLERLHDIKNSSVRLKRVIGFLTVLLVIGIGEKYA